MITFPGQEFHSIPYGLWWCGILCRKQIQKQVERAILVVNIRGVTFDKTGILACQIYAGCDRTEYASMAKCFQTVHFVFRFAYWFLNELFFLFNSRVILGWFAYLFVSL